jgi:Ca-activated chloride channel family protein
MNFSPSRPVQRARFSRPIARFCAGSIVAATLLWAQFKPAVPPPSENPPGPPPPAASQYPAPPQTAAPPPLFSVKVHLVRLLATVRDPTGAILTSLNREDFRVTADGVPQEIAVFERTTAVPLSVAILVDTSGSTRIDLQYEINSVSRFLHALVGEGNPRDSFALYSFNWQVRLETDYGRNPRRAEQALHQLHGSGGTSLYDAIYLVGSELAQREGRHVMVVVSDGGDTVSIKRFADAQRAAQKADAVLYPIVVVPIEGDAGRNLGGEHALATISNGTGGRMFYPTGFEELDTAFSDILHELRTQYYLGFYPAGISSQQRQFHRIQVAMPNAAWRVSVRTGYYEP